jgi:ribosomal protein S18 acetylase RimI-like enzyme
MVIELRSAVTADRPVLDESLHRDLGDSPFVEVVAYAIRMAFDRHTSESHAIVAEHDGSVLGFAVFGTVAGTVGTGRLHFVSVMPRARRQAIGIGLCEAAIADLTVRGDRVVVVEMPAIASFASGRALLRRCGFDEAARVADYYADDVDLLVLRRAVGRGSS